MKNTIYKVIASMAVGALIIFALVRYNKLKAITATTTYNIGSRLTVVKLPIPLRRVCGLESSYEGTALGEPRQFNPDGKPRININNHKDGSTSTDWGACQINDRTWDKKANTLGLDYKNSKVDNYIMALWIYRHDQKGIKNWISFQRNIKKVVR